MTLKKLTLAAVASVALVSSAFAADQTSAAGQWGVGGSFNNYLNNGTNPMAVVTYLNSQFIVQAGMGYQNVKASTDSQSSHTYNTMLQFGMRNMMNNQVSLDYGMNGAYGFGSFKTATYKDPYSVGAFVGVDFMPVQNILFTASISPYTYGRDYTNVKYNEFLRVGSVSVSYMF